MCIRDSGGLYEEGLRVPLVAYRGGEGFAPRRIERNVHHVDLVPSLLELCGLESPGYLPGTSLFAEQDPGPRLFSAVFQRDQAFLAPPLKFVDADHPKRSDWFTDLSADPLELAPLGSEAPEFAERSSRLRRDYAALLDRYPVPGEGPVDVLESMDQAELENMRALGYASAVEREAGGNMDDNKPKTAIEDR